MTSLLPSPANARAAAAPIPVEAPVIRTALPFRSEAMLCSLVDVSGQTVLPVFSLRARQDATASRIASIASGRGKLRRHASATRRDGTGRENGTAATSL